MTRRDRFLSYCLAMAIGVTGAFFLVYGDVIKCAIAEVCR